MEKLLDVIKLVTVSTLALQEESGCKLLVRLNEDTLDVRDEQR